MVGAEEYAECVIEKDSKIWEATERLREGSSVTDEAARAALFGEQKCSYSSLPPMRLKCHLAKCRTDTQAEQTAKSDPTDGQIGTLRMTDRSLRRDGWLYQESKAID